MLAVIKKRRSIREFLDKPVEKEKIEEILKAVMFAPSAVHRRPWEFVVVEDPEKKEALARATPWADFASKAPVVLVLCVDEELSREWLEDAAIAGAHIYLEATNQGLGTCWIQVRGHQSQTGEDSEEFVRQLLGIPAKFRVVALFPLGYPSSYPGEHQDDEYSPEKVHWDQW
ncbi:nitroreductase family protein [bacterium]|nr:nitroreductase family protein [bacterium]